MWDYYHKIDSNPMYTLIPIFDPSFNVKSLKAEADLWGGKGHVKDTILRYRFVLYANSHSIEVTFLFVVRATDLWTKYYKRDCPTPSPVTVVRDTSSSSMLDKAARRQKRVAASSTAFVKDEFERCVFNF